MENLKAEWEHILLWKMKPVVFSTLDSNIGVFQDHGQRQNRQGWLFLGMPNVDLNFMFPVANKM